MLPTHQTTPHPGGILLREFLEPLGADHATFAARVRMDQSGLADLIAGSSPVTLTLAESLARELGTSAAFWLNLQSDYDATVGRG